jgi:parallel beta-helix repeat protein
MVGLTMRNNLVEDTQGMAGGLWCDLDCRDAVFVYNTIRNNPGGPAIIYEVSNHGIIAANVLSGSTYGISVASANTKIFNNTLIDNVQGINVYDDERSPGVDGWDDVGPDTRNVEVVNNVISGKNYSLMASSSKINAPAPNTGGNEVLARVDHNVIHQSNGRAPVFAYWRTLSGEVTLYRRPRVLRAQHGFEANSRWLTGSNDPLFVDKQRGDLRMRNPVADAAPLPPDVAAALATNSLASPGTGAFAPTQ